MTWVYDGDTIAVDLGDGTEIDVRLAGINAPDSGECLHDVARDHLIEALKGHIVRLEVAGTDQFDRTVAHVWEGPTHVNRDLLERGMAIATTPDDDDSQGEALLDTEERAFEAGVGLWGEACGPGSVPGVRIVTAESSPDPPGDDNDNLAGEIVTVVNHDGETLDLSGWVLRDESSRHRFFFPEGLLLDPGEGLGISSADPGWVPGGSPVWNNRGDQAILLDHRGRVVDRWRY